MTNPVIQLTDISASYDEKTVLSHVNLTSMNVTSLV